MADVEQTKKIIPFVTCEVSFCQHVCELVFGIKVPDSNLGIRIDSVKQPIPAFEYHFTDCCLSHAALSDEIPSFSQGTVVSGAIGATGEGTRQASLNR